MAAARILVNFSSLVDDDDFVLDRLTSELAADLADVGEVGYVTCGAGPGSKGVAEIVLATVSVLASAEPDYLRAVVETVAAFLDRNPGRRARLRVHDVELTVDGPSHDEVARMIEIARAAIERSAR